MPRKRIPDHIRRKVVEDFGAGQSKKKIAETYRISATSVSRILEENPSATPENREAGRATDAPEARRKLFEVERRIDDLEKKIQYLEARKQGRGTRS